eukprot:186862_1
MDTEYLLGRNGDSKKPILYGCGCLCVVGVLLTIILIPMSIQSVEHDEYAIRYDAFRHVVYPDVYTEGKYILTPETKLFKYSALVKKVDLAISCLTSNGVPVELDVDVQYQMPKNLVFDAFQNYGEESEAKKYLHIVLTDSVRDTCGNFSAKQYYEDRFSIQNALEKQLISDVKEAHTYYNVTSAVMASYIFPEDLSEAIKEKRAAENQIAIVENQREGALVDANTELLKAGVEADKLEIEAQAEEESILAEANAESSAIYEIWVNRQNVYQDIMNAMNFT